MIKYTKVISDFATQKAETTRIHLIEKKESTLNVVFIILSILSLLILLISYTITKSINRPIKKFISEANAVFSVQTEIENLKFLNEEALFDLTILELKQSYQNIEQQNEEIKSSNEQLLNFNKSLEEKVNERTKELKENETKLLLKNHELAASEEEIRASSEELMSTSEALKISNNELSEAITKSEKISEQYQLLFENMTVGFALHEIICDNNNNPIDYIFLEVNPAFERITGLKANDIKGKRVLEVIPNNEKYWIEKYGHVALTGKPIEFENYSQEIDKYFHVLSYCPKPNQFAVIVENITERKQSEFVLKQKNEEIESQNEEYKQINEELQKAKEKAEESDHLKTVFLENISHEVRTPMNAIIGFSELLLKPDLVEEKQKQYTNNLHKSTNKLLSIVDNTIALAFIETKQLQVNRMYFCPNELLAELFNDYNNKKHIIDKSHIDLKLNKVESVELKINSDYTRLSQIFNILLDNAFKFTENGTIDLGYYFTDDKIHFYVKDTGIGISENKQQLVFKSFTQADKTIRQNFGGLGVGLSIALGLTKLLDGEININSQENMGTKITISLPVQLTNN